MQDLIVEQVRDGVVVLRKPTDTVYYPMTLDEFHCLQHNIILHKKNEGVSLAIRNDGRNVSGNTIQTIQIELAKSDVETLIKELQTIIQ